MKSNLLKLVNTIECDNYVQKLYDVVKHFGIYANILLCYLISIYLVYNTYNENSINVFIHSKPISKIFMSVSTYKLVFFFYRNILYVYYI